MQLIAINKIKSNPENPRFIKDDKFDKLVESLKSFPEMLKLRPIVVNKDMIILGGNYRHKAAKAAGHKSVWIEIADLTIEQQREFIIKDNISVGEWDWDIIADSWDHKLLDDWGLDVPSFEDAEEEELIDLSDKVKSQFKIEIIANNESDQEKIYNKLIAEGYECRLLTL